MEAEVVQDSILYVAGRLDTTVGGPEVLHHLKGLDRSRVEASTFNMLLDRQMDVFFALRCGERERLLPVGKRVRCSPAGLGARQQRVCRRAHCAVLATLLSPKGGPDSRELSWSLAFEGGALGRPPTSQEACRVSREFLAEQTVLLVDLSIADAARLGGKCSQDRPGDRSPAQCARENLVQIRPLQP